MSRLPLLEIPKDLMERIKELGGQPLNLYRALANNPRLLGIWLEFAYSLRDGDTSRPLREVMILRTAQMANSMYEWEQHVKMAKNVGVPLAQIEQLNNWRDSSAFNQIEKVALELTEAVVNNKMTDDIYLQASKHFSDADMVELLLTISFYCMVPRFLNALALTTEGEQR